MQKSLTALLFVVLLGGGLASGAVTFTSPEIGGPSPSSLVDAGTNDVTVTDADLSENRVSLEIDYWIQNNVSIDGSLRNVSVNVSWRPAPRYKWRQLGTYQTQQIDVPGGQRTNYTDTAEFEGTEVGKFETARRGNIRDPSLWIEIDTEIHDIGPNPIERQFEFRVDI